MKKQKEEKAFNYVLKLAKQTKTDEIFKEIENNFSIMDNGWYMIGKINFERLKKKHEVGK